MSQPVNIVSTSLSEQDQATDLSSVTAIQCQYITPNGKPCQEPVEEGEYCKWHDSEQIRTDPAIRLNLQSQIRKVKVAQGYKLAFVDLRDIDLIHHGSNDGYQMLNTDFYRADLRGAHMFRLNLSNSSLMKTNLKGANLHSVNLTNANLLGTILDKTRLEGVIWGEKVLQENQAEICSDPEQKALLLNEAEEVYRNLRTILDGQGHSHTAGYFFRREMIMKRFQMPRFSIQRLGSKLLDLFSGYGEQPTRVILFSMTVIAIFMVLFALFGVKSNGEIVQLSSTMSLQQNFGTLMECLYFSVVTFTTLGYGDITPFQITRLMAATEAFVGAFTMAVFVVMVVKKMSR
ncbi:MAG: pentapeptide repeat-containing protein [Gammaproteobacteria bacterium]|nr:pentapeptide repeat-containing protein [Gammaproteobacteria bacterium]MDH5800191.1 pentapeptide repeat-containing protein [Gammaproteobacteria bacterium]